MNHKAMLLEGADELGIKLSNDDINKFIVYLEELKTWSEKINLTALKKDEEIIVNHFLDSLSILKYLNAGSSLLDIGTGAGFPGVPIAIVCPSCFVTVIDSVQKKIMFVKNIIRKLNIQNAEAISGRAGKIIDNLNEVSFDFVVTRAVSDIANVIKLCKTYIKQDGRIILMRGERGEAELEAISKDLESLELGTEKAEILNLPFSRAKRVNIILKKLV